MAENDAWELPSSAGRETSRWTVTDVHGRGDRTTYRCDVTLAGRFHGEALDATPARDLEDFGLAVRGLELRHGELLRLLGQLREWLSLSPAEHRSSTLDLTCGMGALFDQSLRLSLGPRDDMLSNGLPVATLAFVVGRMTGELAYPVSAGNLQVLADGIERVLERAR